MAESAAKKMRSHEKQSMPQDPMPREVLRLIREACDSFNEYQDPTWLWRTLSDLKLTTVRSFMKRGIEIEPALDAAEVLFTEGVRRLFEAVHNGENRVEC